MRPLSRARMDERRGIIAAAKTLKPERGKLLWNRLVLQLDVVRQSVLVRRRRLTLDQRRNVSAAFRRDVKPDFGDEIARPAQLRMAESVLQTGLGEELPLPVAQALRHGDRAVPVALHDFLDPFEELVLVELDLGKEQYLRRVALPVGGEATGGGDPPRVPAHYFHHEDPRRSLRHRGDVETRFANRGRHVFRDRPETRTVVGDRKIVIDGFGNAHAHQRVSELFADLRDLPGGVCGIVAAVVEEVADVVGSEYLDQTLVMCPVFIDTFQLVAT